MTNPEPPAPTQPPHVERPALTAAEVAFLERCRLDLEPLFGPRDAVLEVVQRPVEDGQVELEAHVVVSGRPATFAARGETVVEAYGRLRAAAPEQRVALAFRALVDGLDPA
jgi:hypothetical protein